MDEGAGIVGVVLCGGRSSRMGGGDKPMLRLGDRAILRRVVERLSPQVRRLAINANGETSRLREYEAPVLTDTVTGYAGPLAGILAGMQWAAGLPGRASLLTVAGDTPFFPRDLAERLAAASARGIAVAASGGRRHPVFALWPVALKDELAHFLAEENDRRVTSFMDGHGAIEVDFPLVSHGGATFDPFFNINTPDDLAEARRIAEAFDP